MGNGSWCEVVKIWIIGFKIFDRVVKTLIRVRHFIESKKNLISLRASYGLGCHYTTKNEKLGVKGAMGSWMMRILKFYIIR